MVRRLLKFVPMLPKPAAARVDDTDRGVERIGEEYRRRSQEAPPQDRCGHE